MTHYKNTTKVGEQTGQTTDISKGGGGGLLSDVIETSVGNESDDSGGSGGDFGEELGGSPVEGGDSGSDDSLSQRVNDITGGGDDDSLGDQVNDIVEGDSGDSGFFDSVNDIVGGGGSGGDDSLSERVNDITGGGDDDSLGDQVNDIVDNDSSPPSTNTGANDPDDGSDGEFGFGIVDDGTIPGIDVDGSGGGGGNDTQPDPQTDPQPEPQPDPQPEPQPPQGILSPGVQAPQSAVAGEDFQVEVVATAQGGATPGGEQAVVRVNGDSIDSQSLPSLRQGDEYRQTYTISVDRAGSTIVELDAGGQRATEEVQITEPMRAEFRATGLTVTARSPSGENSVVGASVANEGNARGDITVPVLVEGVQVSTLTFTDVRPGESITKTQEFTTPDADSYQVSLGKLDVATTATPAEPQEQQQPPQDSEMGIPEPPSGGSRADDEGLLDGVGPRELAIGAGVAAGALALTTLQ